MRTIRATTTGWSTIDLGMTDNEIVLIQAFRFGIGNGIQQEIFVDGGSLDWPPSFVPGSIDLLGHPFATNPSSIFHKRNNGFIFQHLIQMLEDRIHFLAFREGGNFPTMFVMDA
eukprot:CAMPEP_0171003416 /NCGR_PEP_ID=MMETSP0736-20130129/16868_1 /TAXON_ID=186038 /ORGANISM="Fragilariopsis kerguelensis, Strain L26-C5" /LENGTH=113 /DNA_ID=CAMNT_0011432145 /DNA_START=15 /DNA_END=356 /DNA_ORIENTATION=-